MTTTTAVAATNEKIDFEWLNNDRSGRGECCSE